MENNSEEDSIAISSRPKPVFLFLLDGWGVAAKSEANAISLAKAPNFLKLFREYPAGALLPVGGDLNARYFSLGAGRDIIDEAGMAPVEGVLASDLTASISAAGLQQLKIFDSERLAALTYFFNGRREERVAGEDWLAISAARPGKAFDSHLGLQRIIRESLKAAKSGQYDFIVASCSILDSVASTGDLSETIKAMESLDKAIKRLVVSVLNNGGILLIASVQGNAEKMRDLAIDFPDNKATNNPVPFAIFGHEFKGRTIGLKDAPDGDLSLSEISGSLADVAPTVLDLLEIESNENIFQGKSLAN